MKRRLFTFVLAALTIGLLGSCSKINERIDGLDKRVYDLENSRIASVEQQIATINQSIADLSTIRTNIQTLMDAKTAMGEDITKLKAADQTLEGKINGLKTYVNEELAKYATKDWANATFATLEKQAEIIADITKLKQDLTGLDSKLNTAIVDLESTLKAWINTLLEGYYTAAVVEAKISALNTAIEAAKDNANERIDSVATELTTLKTAVDTAKANIRTEYKNAISTAINKLDGEIRGALKDSILAVNGRIEALDTRVTALEGRIQAVEGKVDEILAMIQSVSITPEYSDGSVEAVGGILTLKCIVSPAEAISGMESLKDSLLIYADSVKVKTKAASAYMEIKVSEATVTDAKQGALSLKADISEYLPEGADKALTVALNVKNGISDFTTEFVPVTVTTKPIVTVTFDLNGITGIAPETQKVAEDSKVTKPADPTDMVHTFAGWYKTKDATTGALSDPWDFDNGTVTVDMTLYAKWTRTMKDLLGNDFPKSTTNSAPENAWTNENGYYAFIYFSDGKYFKLDPGNANGIACLTSSQFTRISDGKYVFKYVSGSTNYGVFTLNIEDSKLVSIEYDGTGTNYSALSGTYTAPTLSGVTLNKTELSLMEGKSETLVATVQPENATNKNVTWNSSNESVATVDNDGKVTAVSIGTATITATTVDGAKTASCEVTVIAPNSPEKYNTEEW